MRRERILTAAAAVFTIFLLTAAVANAAPRAPLFSKSATQQGYGSVGGGPGSQVQQPTTQHVAGTTHTVQAAPLGTTNTSGTLPFTGTQLGVFVALGLMLLAGGLLLHRAGRSRSRA